MVGEKGAILIEAKEAAAARSGTIFQSFKASAVLMQPGGASVDGAVNAKQFDVVNTQDTAVEIGDIMLAVKTVQGFYITVSGGGAGVSGFIEFQFDEDEYAADVPSDCASREDIEDSSHRVKVLGTPCGSDGEVEGMDEDGYVNVTDGGGFLDGRDPRALPGKTGFAALIGGEYGSDACGWVIIWINWFREIQVVTDIIFGESSITVQRKLIKVWDDCDLPDEPIEGTDCSEEDY